MSLPCLHIKGYILVCSGFSSSDCDINVICQAAATQAALFTCYSISYVFLEDLRWRPLDGTSEL